MESAILPQVVPLQSVLVGSGPLEYENVKWGYGRRKKRASCHLFRSTLSVCLFCLLISCIKTKLLARLNLQKGVALAHSLHCGVDPNRGVNAGIISRAAVVERAVGNAAS